MKKQTQILAGLMVLTLSAGAGSVEPVSWFDAGVGSGFPNDVTMVGGAWSNAAGRASWDSTLNAVQFGADLETPVSFTNLVPCALGGAVKTVTYDATLTFVSFETADDLPFVESPSKGGVALVSDSNAYKFYVLAKDGTNATNAWTKTSVAGQPDTETSVKISVTRADSSGVASVVYTIGGTTLSAMDLVIGNSSFSSVAFTGGGTLSGLTGACVSNIVSITIPQNTGATVTNLTIGGVKINPPYTGLEGVKGDAVVIVYQADAGYFFAGGATSATVNGTAGTEITIPSDKQAVAAEAKIGSTYYYQLKNAVAAVASGQTIELNANVTLQEQLAINPAGKAFAIDGKGKTVTAVATLETPIRIAGATTDGVILLKNFTLTGGQTTAAALVAAEDAAVCLDEVNLTNYAKAIQASASTVVISNGWFDGEIATANSGRIELFGGYYKTGVSFDETSGTIDGYAGRFVSEAASAPSGVPAEGYTYAPFGVAFTTNSVNFQSSIERDAGEAASVWAVVDSDGNRVGGTYQVSDAFAATAAAGKTGADAQKELSKSAQYTGGTMSKWQCYVLGMEDAATTSTNAGPYVIGLQDASASTIGFQLKAPATIKAAESGCKVAYQIESYDNPGLTGTVKQASEKVDYSQTATIGVPEDGTVRYYKLKVFIAPKE